MSSMTAKVAKLPKLFYRKSCRAMLANKIRNNLRVRGIREHAGNNMIVLLKLPRVCE